MSAVSERQFQQIKNLGIEPQYIERRSMFLRTLLYSCDTNGLIDRFAGPANAEDCATFKITPAQWDAGVRDALAHRAQGYMNLAAAEALRAAARAANLGYRVFDKVGGRYLDGTLHDFVDALLLAKQAAKSRGGSVAEFEIDDHNEGRTHFAGAMPVTDFGFIANRRRLDRDIDGYPLAQVAA